MSKAEWINIAGRALIFCTELPQKTDSLKQQVQSLQEDLERIKDLLNEKQDREGYDTVY